MVVSMMTIMLLVAGAAGANNAQAQSALVPSASVGKVKVVQTDLGVPERINVQGYVTTVAGETLSGSRNMTFRLFDAAGGGTELWNYTGSLTFQAGLFSTVLGIPASHFLAGAQRWLEVAVETQTLSPRTEVTSATFAYRSIKSDTAITPTGPAGGNLAGTYPNPSIAQMGANNGQVLKWTGSAWQPQPDLTGGSGTVTSVSQGAGITCSPNPITTTGTVSFAYSVGNSSGNVTVSNGSTCSNLNADMLDGYNYNSLPYASSGHSHTLSGAVYGDLSSTEISTNAGGSAQIASNAVGSGEIASGAVGTSELEDRGVDYADIADGAVRSRNLYCPGLFSGGAGAVAALTGDNTSSSGNRYGVFGNTSGGWAYLGAVVSGTNYKVIGSGTVSCVMPTRDGSKILFAPECPEPYFEDIGRGRLSNGNARVELDALFLDCIKTDDAHPLNVFIQLNGDCRGVYVEADRTGFDVHELGGGTSNASFTYRVVAIRKDAGFIRLPPASSLPRVRHEHPVVPGDEK